MYVPNQYYFVVMRFGKTIFSQVCTPDTYERLILCFITFGFSCLRFQVNKRRYF